MRRLSLVALILVLVLGVVVLRPGALSFAANPAPYDSLMARAQSDSDKGIVTFAFGGWDALSSDALRVSAAPWKLVNAALALQEAGGDPAMAATVDINALYRRFGFHSPQSFGNWPATLPAPEIATPVGQNVALATRALPPIGATIGNIGCAACHSSVMYDADGAPDLTRVWLGMPNGSINLEAYTQSLFTAMRDHGQDTDALFATLDALYPDTGWRERLTLRLAILPALRDVIATQDASIGRLLPFRASLAGATNGLDSLRNRLGLIPEGTLVTDSIFNSVPDLGGRLWRRKLLNSGSYAIPGQDHMSAMTAEGITDQHRAGLAGIIAFFTVPSMGVTPDVAAANIPAATLVTAWMQDYRPQPFPGPINTAALPEGRAVYARACGACHGSYDPSLTEPRLLSFPNWEGDIGTDPARAALLTEDIANAVNAGLFGQYIAARTVAGYAAPPLTGIWASAPYLHNGSVPTLWHLMRPDNRPVWFEVGGHRLDLLRVGIDLAPPRDYVPWSIPAEVDTTAFGLSAAGHETGFADLSDAEKDALLEYLKLL